MTRADHMLTPAAREELNAFRAHLAEHQGQFIEACRFCIERQRQDTPSSLTSRKEPKP